MRFYLHAFSSNASISKYKLDEYCLSYAFTYRETEDFQGIAWIKVRFGFLYFETNNIL